MGAGGDISSRHKVEITHLSLTQAAMIVIVAMKKEKGEQHINIQAVPNLQM